MRRRTTRTDVVLLVALMVLSLAACRNPFSPQAISADSVPEDVRTSLGREDISDVTWHVSQQNWSSGTFLYAATYTLTARDGYTLRCWWIEGITGTEIQGDHAFLGMTGSGSGIIEGDGDPYNLAVSIDAGGYCFDSRAIEVVAKTTEGREFRCPVTNGFWLIVVNDAKPSPNPPATPAEQWAEITARNSSGRVLHRLQLDV